MLTSLNYPTLHKLLQTSDQVMVLIMQLLAASQRLSYFAVLLLVQVLSAADGFEVELLSLWQVRWSPACILQGPLHTNVQLVTGCSANNVRL
jgi:hypothetical protein